MRLVEFLESHSSFNAPYGVIPSIEQKGKGKVRTITFGVSRYLDACIYIWAPNRIQIRGQGGLAYKVEGDYQSAEAAIQGLMSIAKP